MADSQDEVIAFLSNGASYGFPEARVDRVETHCSMVFLVGSRAYKLKRPVVFSSLDYGTVARREAACRAELRLNRRTAPELYLGVHAISRRADGTLAFDGDGPVVDWVVALRRFDQADLIERLAEAGRLTAGLVTALADEIAGFHQAAERIDGVGGADSLRTAIERNRSDQHAMDAILGHDAIEQLYRASLGALDRVASLLDRRSDGGRLRRCHGDLRLANICLIDDRPTLFDAIEFCDRVSCIDVLYDVAFLLMDLHHRGLDAFANRLFNRYLDATGDDGGLAALPLMLSVRAGTRAYSLAGAIMRRGLRNDERQRAAARSCLGLAGSLLGDASPRVIAVGGLEGSAKSALVHDLAAGFRPAPGARILGSPALKRRLLNLPPQARLMAAAYDAEMTASTYRGLAAAAQTVVQAGYTAIVVANFMGPAHREAIAEAARAAAVPFIGLWLGQTPGATGEAAGLGEWHVIKPAAADAMLKRARRLALADHASSEPG